MKLPYFLNSGKNVKFFYFLKAGLDMAVPHALHKPWQEIWKEARTRRDFDYIMQRVNYYCKAVKPLGDKSNAINEIKLRDAASVYYFDLMEAMQPFPKTTEINFLPGDITFIPSFPSLTKSRPIEGDNSNSVLLKLNRIRHYIWVKDIMEYSDKSDTAIFRGKVSNKEKRMRLFREYFSQPGLDLGDVSSHPCDNAWKVEKMSIADQLKYKFILSIEGNEVASNLKWIMNSNSVAVMPRPEYETWFMEGTLVPGEHYIEIKKDYSDLMEVLNFYRSHPRQAQEISANAREYCRQFRNERREHIITTLVIAKYIGALPDL